MSNSQEGTLRRASWFDAIGLENRRLSKEDRVELQRLDEALFEQWNLGENIFLAWTRCAGELVFLSVRHYRTIEPFGGDDRPNYAFINSLLERPKFYLPDEFEALHLKVGESASLLRHPVVGHGSEDLISRLVTRYSVSHVHDRAVVLLDIVGFSLHPPLEQLAMLNSLSYSVNSAYRQLLTDDIGVNFARSSTGDGFYLWNRARTVGANVALYQLLMLLLADNALARKKARRFPVPELRAGFHVGEHYEFYQVEALNPTTFSYIVGPVTIELSRMVEKALPGQILLGDFKIPMRGGGDDAVVYSTADFVSKAAELMPQLVGLDVAHDRIAAISCYLTGPKGEAAGDFRVRQYRIRDKHGMHRLAYNAKMNIRFKSSPPMYLGYQDSDLRGKGILDDTWAEA